MSLKNKIVVTKASGVTEPFSIKKLRNSLGKAKATSEEINSIIDELLPKLYQGCASLYHYPISISSQYGHNFPLFWLSKISI